ncbi:hypothetical protein SAMN02745146_3475 [Hymenobacter daecheongensis DSM 21074]|uniref:Por secretion system C-terminal sorting domain-containing protein n=1 Tax=Hymenobacter daecheongensis DSM 21074 TaxID=1121955 RepID=A0A1M6KLC5_9BACT|nr:hypothetical protein [Hymenobacter daecheongensis]SHJ59651.1 hypothetical protein SAMN02745146_3475 [Hymenobacter daecheongensis DSM 21074]
MRLTSAFLLLLLALAARQPAHAQVTTSAVTSFTLVNADTDEDIKTLGSVDSVNLALLPTRNLNIRANTSPATVGSVVFVLSGADSQLQTESVPPYALFSDVAGNYNPWTPPVGTYSLTATPYSEAGGAGSAGAALTIGFRVFSRVSTPTAQRGPAERLALQAYPNPSADGRYRIVLSEPVQGSIAYALCTGVGAQLAAGTLAGGPATTVLALDLARQLPAGGIYYLHLRGKKLNAQVKVVRL